MRSARSIGLAIALALSGFASPLAAESDPVVLANLAKLIEIKELPCAGVVDYERQGPYLFLARCNNGKRYLISRDQSGSVLVQEIQ